MSKSLHSKENQALTAWLKKRREASGLTMRQLASIMGVQHTFVSKVEQRERRLDVVEYLLYCRALGVSAEEGLMFIQKLEKELI
tara:strand:- start:322 stop:573 length:252 start_codon:yes stop_codon:yes gene_type:complete